MRKYELSTEQFKMIMMPFIDAALKSNAEKVKAHNFKIGQISKMDRHLPPKYDGGLGDFKVEFTAKGYDGYFNLSVDAGARLYFLEFASTPITDYLFGHREEINEAFRTYLYEHYGEEFKEHLIEVYKAKKEENLAHIQQEREELKKELAALDKEEKETIENYDAEIDDIENSLTQHHI